MKALKVLFLPGLIALGVVVGGYLSFEYSTGFFLGGAVLGGLLAGLIYFLIKLALSRRTSGTLPYDSLDERHQVHSLADTQTPEARISETRDKLIGENPPWSTHR